MSEHTALSPNGLQASKVQTTDMKTSHTVSRRQFLRITAASAVAGLAAIYGMEAMRQPPVITENRVLMGTIINLTVIGNNQQEMLSALNACLDHMEKLEHVFSRFNPASQLSRLNRDGRLFNPDPTLVEVLNFSNQISRLSNGAFDVSIKPVIDEYVTSQNAGNGLPANGLIAGALTHVDYRQIEIAADQITFGLPGMSITLDGVAKGYIVDAGVTVLQEHGLSNILVEAGGDLLAVGAKSADKAWNVGIRSPRSSNTAPLETIRVNDRAVATSGDYVQAYHILDPQTGNPRQELVSATVVAPTTMQADALATTIMVMGEDLGLSLIEQISNCEAFIINNNLSTVATPGFYRFTNI